MAIARVAVAAVLSWTAMAAGRPQTCLAGEQLLMQTSELKMRQRAARRPPVQALLVQADGQIAKVLRKRATDPTQIAAAVQKGLTGVMGAVKHFMAQPPEVEQGLNVLGDKLLEAIHEPIEEHFDDAAAYAEFRAEWMKFFDGAAATAPSVQGNITLYQEDGSPEAVIMAVADILTLLSDGVVMFVPQETAQEVVKYVDAISDVLGALGTSWAGFESGQEAQAIEDLYFGLRAALDQILPPELQNDEIYKLVIGTLDGIICNLSETVLEFQRQIVEGAVCWKVQKSRQRKRPDVCPEGFYWNGEHLCLPVPGSQSGEGSGASLVATSGRLEGTVARKTGSVDSATGGKQRIPNGARVALCKETGNYTEKMGSWCYAACPDGMVSKGLQCKTTCHGEFPSDDGAMMCGHNPGVIAEAIMNMVIGVTNGAINSGLLILAGSFLVSHRCSR